MRLLCLLIPLLLSVLSSCNNISVEQKPNVVLILADDMGYGDLGSYGCLDINTPNIDKLADEGMKFTDHYSGGSVCAPARMTLITGPML